MAYNKEKIKKEISVFLKQYQRKSDCHVDSNDRRYSRKIEQKIKRMKPEELQEILFEDSSDS